MISKDKKRIILTLPKEQEKAIREEAENRGITASEVVMLALSGLIGYKGGTKLGEVLAELITKGDKRE